MEIFALLLLRQRPPAYLIDLSKPSGLAYFSVRPFFELCPRWWSPAVFDSHKTFSRLAFIVLSRAEAVVPP